MAVDGEAPSFEPIEDARAGIAFANKKIALLEEMSAEARKQGDLKTSAKCEGFIYEWTELLQQYLRMNWQQGGQSTDASKGVSKYSERQRRKQRFK